MIADGLRSFVEVGRALSAIRDGGLYLDQGFKNFESYCRDRWEMARAHAYRLIDGAAVVENVTHGRQTPALNERQARELARLKDADAQAEAWAEAVASAPPSGVTAKHVADVVAYTKQHAGSSMLSALSQPVGWIQPTGARCPPRVWRSFSS